MLYLQIAVLFWLILRSSPVFVKYTKKYVFLLFSELICVSQFC